jgi:Ca2+-binding EF-hand superfamily protein
LNGDGTIDTKEFKNCMINMGFRKITDEECSKMLAE